MERAWRLFVIFRKISSLVLYTIKIVMQFASSITRRSQTRVLLQAALASLLAWQSHLLRAIF